MVEDIRVHEGFAAGKSDFLGLPVGTLQFIEILLQIVPRQIGQPIISRTRFDVAILTRHIAQRAGVEPQHAQAAKRHVRARLAIRSARGILEFSWIEGRAQERLGLRHLFLGQIWAAKKTAPESRISPLQRPAIARQYNSR